MKKLTFSHQTHNHTHFAEGEPYNLYSGTTITYIYITSREAEAERGNGFIYRLLDQCKQGILLQALIFFLFVFSFTIKSDSWLGSWN
jgi:hypothetical protein